MPWGDKTGPMGMGPRTGRAMGFCSGFNAPGYMNAGPGFGRGRGFGRGFRRWAVMPQDAWYPAQPMPQPTKAEEIAELKAQKEAIEAERNAIAEDMKAIDARLKELEKKNK